MLSKEILSLLGLATRARKITTGDILINDIRSKKTSFVIIAKDCSENSKKKITDKCHFYSVDYVIIGTTDELSHAIGKINRVAIGINDKGFANKIKSILGG